MLPFLNILPLIFEHGHDLLLKLHTKRSTHLKNNVQWRTDLFNKLIGEDGVKKAIELFNDNPHIGLVGPAGHIVPMCLYYGANAARVEMLGRQMGIWPQQMAGLTFVAGSMFYARKEALKPLLDLKLVSADFEAEIGQTDGTLAHVLERAIGLSVISADLQMADTCYDRQNPTLRVINNYRFSI